MSIKTVIKNRTYLNPEWAKTTRNQLKRAETGWKNDLKPAKTTQKNSETTWNDPKFENWENLQFSTSFWFPNFEPKYPNLGILGQKVLTF